MRSFRRIMSLFLAVMMISGIAVVSASADTAAEKVSGTFDMHIAFSTDTKTDRYFYCDDYFAQSGKVSNEYLRTMSAALTFTLCGKSETPEAVYGKLPSEIGFENIAMYDMDSLTKDTMGVVFGKKTIGGNTVVLVALRSDDYGAEWASNFISGETGDISGFAAATALIKSRLDKYLSDNAVTNAKFWVTGYSRGGAVANLLGKSLNEHIDDYGITADDIYVYTFDAPRSSFELTSYANIHNVVDSCDVIPYVYPENWGIYNSGVVEPIGSDDETIMTKQFSLFSPDPTDYKEVKTSDFLREFADFLGTNLSRETFSRSVSPYISRIAEIYFNLNDDARESFVEFFKAVLTSVNEDENKLSVILPLIADGSGQEDIDKVVEFLLANIDKVAQEKGKPVDEESFGYIRSSVEPLVNAFVPVFITDLKGPLPDDADNMSLLYHILSFSNNVENIIKHHYNYNIFDELKALDSNYSEEPAADPTRATDPTETTGAAQPSDVTEPTKAPAPATSLSVKALKKTICVGKTTKVTAEVKNAVGDTVFKSDNSSVAVVKVNGNTAEIKGKSKGSANITATNNGVSASVKITVNKNKNTIKVKGLTVKAKAKAKTVIKKTKAFSIRSAQGKVTFKKLSGDKKITVSKSGNIVVNKGLKKGKSYKLNALVTAKGNGAYYSLNKKVTVKIKIV